MNALLAVFFALVFIGPVVAEPLVEGRVRLDSGEPVADAQVRVFDLSDLRQGAIARATTDGTGYFALPLAALGGHALPPGFALGPNYPNPFNPSTIIPYQLAALSEVRLEVFNLLGQRIVTLVDGERPAGSHTATWHATDEAGRAVGAGVYIYRMTVGAASQTGRMVLLDGQAGVAAGAASVGLGASDGRSHGEDAQAYGLIVSGAGLAPYMDSAFRVEAGMAPVELVVSAGHSAGKATDDGALYDLFDVLNDAPEEDAEDTPEDEGVGPSGKAQATLAAPPPPTNLRFEAVTDSSARVRWDAAEGATDYDVNYKPAVGGRWTNQPHRGVRLYTTIDDLALGTEYRWAVRAENSDGYSAWVFGPNFTTVEEEDETTGSSDAHSNTRSGATSLALGSSLTGQIDPGSDVDYFSVQVSASGTLTVYTTGSLDTQGTLENSSGSGLASNDDGGRDTNFRIERAVSVGTYYIKVESYRSRTGSYTIHANETTEGEAEDAPEEEDETTDDAPVTIPDAKLRAAIAEALGKASGETITKGEMATLRRLDAMWADIHDLTGLEFATHLTELLLGFSYNITDLTPLSGLTKLTELNLRYNNISDISALRGLTNLTSLDLETNNISDISALRGLTHLRWLNLWDNNISDVSSLGGLTKLESLALGVNNITDVSPLSGLTNLWKLGLGHTNITDLTPLSGLTKLNDLDLRDNNLTNISALRGLTHLTQLWLHDNNISDISALRGLTRLTELVLDRNNISDISALRGLTRLRQLYLKENPLSVSSINDHIPALQSIGATVWFDVPPLGESDFDIELVFLDDHFPEKQKRMIRDAARRWMSIIRGDLPDYTFAEGWSGWCGEQSYTIPSGERIDDLRIYVTALELEDYIGGRGGPDVVRETHLSVVGCVELNLKYLDDLHTSTVLHEIGHVLGFGTVFHESGFLQISSDDPHFAGPQAIAAFDNAGGWNYAGAKVPVTKDGGHWRGVDLSRELMAVGAGHQIALLSAITIQALADLGYVVDVTQAEPYILPSAAAKVVVAGSTPDDRLPGSLDVRHRHRAEPIHVVDEQGRIVRTLHR